MGFKCVFRARRGRVHGHQDKSNTTSRSTAAKTLPKDLVREESRVAEAQGRHRRNPLTEARVANVFLLLASYYLLKTVREALILSESGAEVKSYAAFSFKFLATHLLTIVLVSVSRAPVNSSYHQARPRRKATA